MKKLAIILLIGIMMSACAAQPIQPTTVIMTIDGAAEVVDATQDHPCKGNWNFCDHVLAQEKLIIPGEYDEYGSYMYPEF
jgi:hypothetical protein